MKKEYLKRVFIAFAVVCLLISCTEEYALQTNTFEDAIVIEATITNELKKQEIKISKTYRLEENEPSFVTNATVYILDDLGNQFDFEEINNKYISTIEFQAVPDREYKLYITTNEGKQYTSTKEKLTTANTIDQINVVAKNKYGVDGVEMSINSYDPTNTSKYYRYEYEETSKIIVPLWSGDSLKVFGNAENWNIYGSIEYALTVVPRTGESKTCFKTEKSKDIILYTTNNLSEDRVLDFPIRFISKDNHIIANRYSLLVKQYVQNLSSFIFYKTLRDISSTGSVLSPNQPGFITGNISSLTNENEKIIGFFDVSSVSTKRIFFNYNDVFPGAPLPAYFYECEIKDYDKRKKKTPGNTPSDGLTYLATLTRQGSIILYQANDPIYRMVIPQCGDCRTLGSNIIPNFWE
jgi:archaellin